MLAARRPILVYGVFSFLRGHSLTTLNLDFYLYCMSSFFLFCGRGAVIANSSLQLSKMLRLPDLCLLLSASHSFSASIMVTY